jgi:hypothetical protein
VTALSRLGDSMTGQNPKLKLELNPNRLSAIIGSAVIASTEIVNLHFRALAADLRPAEETSGAVYKFNAPALNAEQRRSMHENWILAKAFQDLLRAVRLALEEAYVMTVLLTRAHRVKSNATLSEFLKPFQSKAAGLKFPDLIAAVNESLDPKLEFADSYKSLQQARNCLEHRDAIVSTIETHGKDTFILKIPRIKIFYLRNGGEIELVAGERVDAGDGREQVEVLMRFEVREKFVALGERLIFTLAEFNEIAFACNFLGQQLSSRLPKPMVA